MDDRPRLPSELDFPAFLMNAPFSVDNREANNDLMDDEAEPYDMDRAFDQFMGLYKALATKGGLVYILPSGWSQLQDLPYVANIGAALPHRPEIMLLSNYTSPPRQGEDILGARFFSEIGFQVHQTPTKWEGEADLKYLRDNIYVGGYGQRSERSSFVWMEDTFGLEVTMVELSDEKLYHLDCSVFPLTGEKLLVATSCFTPEEMRSLEAIAEIVSVPPKNIYDGWTNSVRIGKTILSNVTDQPAKGALARLLGKHGFSVEPVDLGEFDKSGADLSCMVCHLNWQNRPEEPEAKIAAPPSMRTEGPPSVAARATAAPPPPAGASLADSM